MSDTNAAIDTRVDTDVQKDLKGEASSATPASSAFVPAGDPPPHPDRTGDLSAIIDYVDARVKWATGK